MTYREPHRLTDIQALNDAIRSHLQRGQLSDLSNQPDQEATAVAVG